MNIKQLVFIAKVSRGYNMFNMQFILFHFLITLRDTYALLRESLIRSGGGGGGGGGGREVFRFVPPVLQLPFSGPLLTMSKLFDFQFYPEDIF